MVGGGAEDIEGGPSIIFQASRGGQVKNEQTRGGPPKMSVEIDICNHIYITVNFIENIL